MSVAVGVIPARLESVRLPRKMLREICGRPLIQWTYENAKRAPALREVIVATDSPEIESCVRNFGGQVRLTRKDHPSGTSRIAEIAGSLEAEILVNVQGDEPRVDVNAISNLVKVFADPGIRVATLAVSKQDAEEFRNPNVVKVVKDASGFALYFSRSPIPYDRDGKFRGFLKHLGVYAYRRDFLVRDWGKLKPSLLEESEKLEQLRILDNGFSIKVVEVPEDSVGIDTEEDLIAVEKILSGGK